MQLGIELLAGTHSSSCSGHHNGHNGDADDDDYGDDDHDDNDDDDEDHLDSALEESFAGLAGENAIVEPGNLVSAHLQKQKYFTLCLKQM